MPEDIIKARIVFDTSGLKGLGGGLGKQAGAAPADGLGALAKGGKGSLLGAGAIAGAVAAGVTAIISVLKKGFATLIKASPKLNATLQVMSKGLMLILRPIGDMMAIFFRPMAFHLIRFGQRWLKNFQGWFDNLNTTNAELSEEERTAIESAKQAPTTILFGDITDAITALSEFNENIDLLREKMGPMADVMLIIADTLGLLRGLWDTLVGSLKVIWAVLRPFLKLALDMSPLGGILDKIIPNLMAFGGFMQEIGDALLALTSGEIDIEQFKQLAGEAWFAMLDILDEIWGPFWDDKFAKFAELWDGMKAIWTDFKNWVSTGWDKLKTKVTEVFNSLKAFFAEDVLAWIMFPFNTLQKFFLETIPQWIGEMISKIKSLVDVGGAIRRGAKKASGLFSNVVETARGTFERRQAGGLINPNTPTLVGEAGPELITASRSGFIQPNEAITAGGRGTTINVSVNALDQSSITQQTLNMITDAVSQALKGGLSRRSTESFAIGL